MTDSTSNSNSEIAPAMTEGRVQSDCFKWFWNTYPDLRGMLYHVPNGELRDKITAARLKAMGVVSGVPDIVLHYQARTWFFEFKSAKGVESDAQKELFPRLRKQGFSVVIIRDIEDFKIRIEEIMLINFPGLSREDYFFGHKVFSYLFMDMSIGHLVEVDEICDEANKGKFIYYLKKFIYERYGEAEGFEIRLTNDLLAFYKVDPNSLEPIFYKGYSVWEPGDDCPF